MVTQIIFIKIRKELQARQNPVYPLQFLHKLKRNMTNNGSKYIQRISFFFLLYFLLFDDSSGILKKEKVIAVGITFKTNN